MLLKRHLILLAILIGCLQQLCAQDSNNYPPYVTDVSIDSTNLPIVFIHVNGDTIQKNEKITARMKIIDNGNGKWNYADTVAHQNQMIDYDGYISINYRGNTSYTLAPKKSYTIRTLAQPLEEGGKKQKVQLLGMGKDNNWALLANYSDRSMMRNLISYELARPFVDFSPTGKYCEVFVDSIYYGLYILMEKVTKGKFRLNLTEPEDEGDALTGDYLLDIDRPNEIGVTSLYYPLDAEGNEMTAAQKNVYQFSEPDADEITKNQKNFIKNRIWQMERALVGADPGSFTVAENGYIAPQSFIDYTLSNEFANNVDAFRFSVKFYKRRDSVDPLFKLSIWDMELTYGCAAHEMGYRTDVLVHKNHDHSWIGLPRWVDALADSPDFEELLHNRWLEYRDDVYTEEHVYALIDSLSSQLTMGGAIERNAKAWKMFGKHIWPNYFDAKNYEQEVNYIKQWIRTRFLFMDNWLQLPRIPGDVNCDRRVNVSDVSELVNMILGISPMNQTTADVDESGKVNVSDVAALINIILAVN